MTLQFFGGISLSWTFVHLFFSKILLLVPCQLNCHLRSWWHIPDLEGNQKCVLQELGQGLFFYFSSTLKLITLGLLSCFSYISRYIDKLAAVFTWLAVFFLGPILLFEILKVFILPVFDFTFYPNRKKKIDFFIWFITHMQGRIGIQFSWFSVYKMQWTHLTVFISSNNFFSGAPILK